MDYSNSWVTVCRVNSSEIAFVREAIITRLPLAATRLWSVARPQPLQVRTFSWSQRIVRRRACEAIVGARAADAASATMSGTNDLLQPFQTFERESVRLVTY